MMLKNFALYDGDINDKQVGTFTYDTKTKQFSMSLMENVTKEELPLSLEGYANNENYLLSHEDTMRWIRGRICPPGRHNIREILRDNGLTEYDEFGLLMITKAKCDKDNLYLSPL